MIDRSAKPCSVTPAHELPGLGVAAQSRLIIFRRAYINVSLFNAPYEFNTIFQAILIISIIIVYYYPLPAAAGIPDADKVITDARLNLIIIFIIFNGNTSV
jgi:hypothetical protein